MKELISIITVVKRDRKGLNVTKNSIANQKKVNLLEWVVIDGCTKEPSLIGDKKDYKSFRIKYINEEDGGIYAAMNRGIAEAEGKYILFINAGDRLAKPETIDGLEPFLSEKIDMILCQSIYKFGSSIEFIKKPAEPCKKIWHSMPASHQAILYKTELAKETLYNTKYRICADYLFTYEIMLKSEKIKVAEYIISEFDTNGISSSKPWSSILETIDIQRNHLKLKRLLIIVSLLRRIASMGAYQMLRIRGSINIQQYPRW